MVYNVDVNELIRITTRLINAAQSEVTEKQKEDIILHHIISACLPGVQTHFSCFGKIQNILETKPKTMNNATQPHQARNARGK